MTEWKKLLRPASVMIAIVILLVLSVHLYGRGFLDKYLFKYGGVVLMERAVLIETSEYLLAHHFRNKKEMACEIGVSYRTLLNCCMGKGTHNATNIVSAKLIRYCVENWIMLGEAIRVPD